MTNSEERIINQIKAGYGFYGIKYVNAKSDIIKEIIIKSVLKNK